MSRRVNRLLYRNFLRKVEAIETRAPPAALPLIQRLVLGADNLQPLGRAMVRERFRGPPAANSPDPFTVLQALNREVDRLPPTLQNVLYPPGTVFRHREWGFTGIIYDHDPVCLGHLHADLAARMTYGFYQPFYRVLVDNHHDQTHYVPQEWVEVIPTRQIRNRDIDQYFVFDGERYLAKEVQPSREGEPEAAKEKEKEEEAVAVVAADTDKADRHQERDE